MDAIEAGMLKAFQDMRDVAAEAQAEIARLRELVASAYSEGFGDHSPTASFHRCWEHSDTRAALAHPR